jgi:hypothetical protein
MIDAVPDCLVHDYQDLIDTQYDWRDIEPVLERLRYHCQ